ncbi:Protein YIF1B [Taenia crassiceps]|uniref:Protein YIF1 n=1 Tax=Taenia crassiceps TaxID=6207 RepID=A0ABR4QTS6_9CEST
MDPYRSAWGGQSVNSNPGQFYAPPDVSSYNYPQQYYGPASYQHSAQFNPGDGPVFVNQFTQNVAMQYGSEAIGQGKQLVQEKVGKYISLSKLKHYFAVDNAYVAGKLGILFFPFFHSRWDLQYDAMGVVSPREDINSPDLYIPAIAFITYVVAAGVSLGVEGRFAPDLLVQSRLPRPPRLLWIQVCLHDRNGVGGSYALRSRLLLRPCLDGSCICLFPDSFAEVTGVATGRPSGVVEPTSRSLLPRLHCALPTLHYLVAHQLCRPHHLVYCTRRWCLRKQLLPTDLVDKEKKQFGMEGERVGGISLATCRNDDKIFKKTEMRAGSIPSFLAL